jgi:DNA-binding transcriptional ArsR family regulator
MLETKHILEPPRQERTATIRAETNQGVEVADVAGVCRALASQVRVDLLHALQVPTPLSRIRVPARRRDRLGQPGRNINRVTVRRHLSVLLQLGLVQRVTARQGKRVLDHYVVDVERVRCAVRCLNALEQSLSMCMENSADVSKTLSSYSGWTAGAPARFAPFPAHL